MNRAASMASATSASRNQMASRRSLPPGAHPAREVGKGVVVVDDDGLDEQVLALQEQLTARLGSCDGGCGHEFGHLSDRVGAQVVVAEVVAHAGCVATCLAHQA